MSLIQEMQRFTTHLETTEAERVAFVGGVRKSVEDLRRTFRLESQQRRDHAQRRAWNVAKELNRFRMDFSETCESDAQTRQAFHAEIQRWVGDVREVAGELRQEHLAEDRTRLAETRRRARQVAADLRIFTQEFTDVCALGADSREAFVAEVRNWVESVRQAVETLRGEHRVEQQVRTAEANERSKTVAAELEAFAEELQEVSEQGYQVREAFLNHVQNWVGDVRQTTVDLRKQFVVERAVVCKELQSFRRLWMNHLLRNGSSARTPASEVEGASKAAESPGDAETEDLQSRFLSVLTEQKRGMRLSEVGEQLSKPWQQLTSAASALLDEGKIVKRHGVYFLPDDAPEGDATES